MSNAIHKESSDHDLMRRRKIISMPAFEIARCLFHFGDVAGQIRFPKVRGLPDGYIVSGAFYDAPRDSFCFIVVHPSFDVVAQGIATPEIEVEFFIASLVVRE